MKLFVYILKEHIAPFILALFVITFLFLIDFIIRLLDLVLSKNLDPMVILEIFVLNIAWMLALSIPMSCLVASLMAFGRLASNNEIVAFKSSGLSPFQILTPAFTASIIICVLLILFNNYVLPHSNHRSVELQQSIIQKKAPAFIDTKKVIKDFPGYRIWIDSIDYETNKLHNIKIYKIEQGEPPQYLYSKNASMRYSNDNTQLLLYLNNGENHVFDQKEDRYLKIKFKQEALSIPNVNSKFTRKERNNRSDRELPIEDMLIIVKQNQTAKNKLSTKYKKSIFQQMEKIENQLTNSQTPKDSVQIANILKLKKLNYRQIITTETKHLNSIESYTNQIKQKDYRIHNYLVEIHKKISLPFACILFVIIGGCLGMGSQKGKIWKEALVCCFLFIVYWICLLRGESFADKLIIKPWVAMWTPNVILLIVALFLLKKTLKITKV